MYLTYACSRCGSGIRHNQARRGGSIAYRVVDCDGDRCGAVRSVGLSRATLQIPASIARPAAISAGTLLLPMPRDKSAASSVAPKV
jgi:hypothetical protein